MNTAARNARYCTNNKGITQYRDDGQHTVCPQCGADFGLGDSTGNLPLHDKPEKE